MNWIQNKFRWKILQKKKILEKFIASVESLNQNGNYGEIRFEVWPYSFISQAFWLQSN